MSKQNLYKVKKARERREVDEELVAELVRRERLVQPEAGGLKLYHELKEELAEAGVRIGRDRFFEVLRQEGLLLERRRSRGPRTTDSRHRFRVYTNLVRDRVFTGPNQGWACDITYIRTEQGFLYLSLIMDLYSRKIVGYHIGDSLEVTGCLVALGMAIAQLPANVAPIHHSDRGSQYCCNEYVKRLGDRGIAISMTEENHCYENAKAERLNGILKQEYYLGECFRTKADAKRAAGQAVELYNTRRRHRALKMRKPQEVHSGIAA